MNLLDLILSILVVNLPLHPDKMVFNFSEGIAHPNYIRVTPRHVKDPAYETVD